MVVVVDVGQEQRIRQQEDKGMTRNGRIRSARYRSQ